TLRGTDRRYALYRRRGASRSRARSHAAAACGDAVRQPASKTAETTRQRPSVPRSRRGLALRSPVECGAQLHHRATAYIEFRATGQIARGVRAAIDGRTAKRPGYFALDAKINRSGPTPLADLPVPHAVSAAEIPELQKQGAIVLDTRPAAQF